MSLVATSLGGPDPARRGRSSLLSPLGSPLASPPESSPGSPSDSSFGVALDVLVTKGGLLGQDDVQRIDPFVDDFLQAGSQLMELWVATIQTPTTECSARATRRNRRALSTEESRKLRTRNSRRIGVFVERLAVSVNEDNKTTAENEIDSQMSDTMELVYSQTKDMMSKQSHTRKRKYSMPTESYCHQATTSWTDKQRLVEKKLKVPRRERSTSPVEARFTRSRARLLLASTNASVTSSEAVETEQKEGEEKNTDGQDRVRSSNKPDSPPTVVSNSDANLESEVLPTLHRMYEEVESHWTSQYSIINNLAFSEFPTQLSQTQQTFSYSSMELTGVTPYSVLPTQPFAYAPIPSALASSWIYSTPDAPVYAPAATFVHPAALAVSSGWKATPEANLSQAWYQATPTILQPIWTTTRANIGATPLVVSTATSPSVHIKQYQYQSQYEHGATAAIYTVSSFASSYTVSSALTTVAPLFFSTLTIPSCMMQFSAFEHETTWDSSMAQMQMLPVRQYALNLAESPGLEAAPIPSAWFASHYHKNKCEVCAAALFRRNMEIINSLTSFNAPEPKRAVMREWLFFLLDMTSTPHLKIIPTHAELLDLTGLDCTSSPILSPAASPTIEETLDQHICEVGDVPLVDTGPDAVMFVEENSSDFIAAELQAIEAEKKEERSNAVVGCSEDSSICSGGSNCGSSSFYGECSDSNEANTPTSSPSRQRPSPSSPSGPQQCLVCNKVFSNGSALAKHKLIHSEERRYVCIVCQKAFKRQDHLNGHMLTHRNKKPYECTLEGCNKSYCDSRSLRRHEENHHNMKGLLATKSKIQDSERLKAEKKTGPKNVRHQISLDCDSGTNDCSSNSSDCSTLHNESTGKLAQISTQSSISPLKGKHQILAVSPGKNELEDEKKNIDKFLVEETVTKMTVVKIEQIPQLIRPEVHPTQRTPDRTDSRSMSSTVTSSSFAVLDQNDSSTQLQPQRRFEAKAPAAVKADQLKHLRGQLASDSVNLFEKSSLVSTLGKRCGIPNANLIQEFSTTFAAQSQIPIGGKSGQTKMYSNVLHSSKQKSVRALHVEPSTGLAPGSNIVPLAMRTERDTNQTDGYTFVPSWSYLKESSTNAISSHACAKAPVDSQNISTGISKCRPRDDGRTEKIPGNIQIVNSRRTTAAQSGSRMTSVKDEKGENIITFKQETASETPTSAHQTSAGDIVSPNRINRGPNKTPARPNSGSESSVHGNINELPISSSKASEIVSKSHDIASTTPSKPVACNLCNRRFKNIPALNGHMRLHGGYFKKESESKRADKRESTGPPLQTASVTVRKLINYKITQRQQAGSPTITPSLSRDESATVTSSFNHFSKVSLSSEIVATSSVLQHHNYANNLMPAVNTSYCDQISPSVLSTPMRSISSYSPSSPRNDQLLNHSEDPLLSSTIKDIAVRKSELRSHSLMKSRSDVRKDGLNSIGQEVSTMPLLLSSESVSTKINSFGPKREKVSEDLKLFAPMVLEPPSSQNSPPKRARIDTKFPLFKSQIRNCRRETVVPKSMPYTPAPILNPNRPAVGLYVNLPTVMERSEHEKGNSNTDASVKPECDSFPHINVGARFQASIPVCAEDPYEWTDESESFTNEPIWRPGSLSKCTASQDMVPGAGSNKEHALHVLSMCNGNIHDAMTRILQPNKILPPSSPLLTYNYGLTKMWNKEEMEKFVTAIKMAGKDFEAVSKKVSTKTIQDCVQLYYLWKQICVDEYSDSKDDWCDKSPPRTHTVNWHGENTISTSSTTEPTGPQNTAINVFSGCQSIKKEIPSDNSTFQQKKSDIGEVGPMLTADHCPELDVLGSETVLTREELAKSGITDEHITVMAQFFLQSLKSSEDTNSKFLETIKVEPWDAKVKENFKLDITMQDAEKLLQPTLMDVKQQLASRPTVRETTKEVSVTLSKASSKSVGQSLMSSKSVRAPYGPDGESSAACDHTSETASGKELMSKRTKQAKSVVQTPVSSPSAVENNSVSPDSRLYACDVADCFASFNSKGALSGHLRIHGPRKSPPPTGGPHQTEFKCEPCGKIFSKMKILQAHKKVHQKLLRFTEKARLKKETCLTFTTCNSFGLFLSSEAKISSDMDDKCCTSPAQPTTEVKYEFGAQSLVSDSSLNSEETPGELKTNSDLISVNWSSLNVLKSIRDTQHKTVRMN